MVLTPGAYFAWVKSDDIAYVSSDFINRWQRMARKGMVAVSQTEASVMDLNNNFQFSAYIGAIYPLAKLNNKTISILVAKKGLNNQAIIKKAKINKSEAVLMPLKASKDNIAMIIKQLLHRPYGWGGAFFLNDCSQELKNLFTPFGIWLPRNSGSQALYSKAVVDLSNLDVKERLSYLKQKGHPLMTLIYIEGHIMLYVGNRLTADKQVEAMTYQNIWGLSPLNRDKRYVIGQSVFLPLLTVYPERPDIQSLANKHYFKLIYLDKLDKSITPEALYRRIFLK